MWKYSLRSGAVARSGPVAVSFFVQARTMPLLPNAPPLPGGADFPRLYPRVMECLGSYDNTESFVLLHKEINAAKKSVSSDVSLPPSPLLFSLPIHTARR